jgi:hypothetical protein
MQPLTDWYIKMGRPDGEAGGRETFSNQKGNGMKEINIGGVRLFSDGNTLTITGRIQPDLTVSLDSVEVEMLIHFVLSLAGTGSNRRQSFRVPLHEPSGLSTQIRVNQKQLSVTPTSISVTGIFVELRPEDWLDLAIGDILDVILEFEGEIQTYHGSVRRGEAKGYGLFFTESMNGEEIDPPPELLRLVMELQHRWMARRSKIVP